MHLRFHACLLLLGTVLYFLCAYPLSFHLATRAAEFGDSILNDWVLAWDARALFDPHLSVWNAPIFHPSPGILAFGDNLFGVLWISLPVQWLTGNPTLAGNVVGLVAFVLCFYTGALLAHALTDNIPASVVAGFIFAFHPIRWVHLGHLQLMSFYWAPLALLSILKFFKSRRCRYIWFAAAAICIQYYCSVYLGTMLGVLTITFALAFLGLLFITDKPSFSKLPRSALIHIALAGIVSAIALLPIAVPYLRWGAYWGIFRNLEEATLFASEPLSFFKPLGFAHYGWMDTCLSKVRGGEGAAFLGWVPMMLTALGVAALFLTRRSGDDKHTQSALTVTALFISAMVMAVLMFGPYFIWMGKVTKFPLPYQLVYYLVPGGKAIRSTGRFFQPLLLCLSMVAAFGWALLSKILARRGKALPYCFLSGLVLLFSYDFRYFADSSVPAEHRKDFPPVYQYLEKGPANRAVLELPADTDHLFRYFLYQTGHWRPEIGGRTGHDTPAFAMLSFFLHGSPEDSGLNLLRLSPTETLVVHLDQYDPLTRRQWENARLEQYGFQRQGRFGDALVWERTGQPPETSSRLRIANYDFIAPERTLRMYFSAEDSRPWSHPELGVDRLTVRATYTNGTTREIDVPFQPPPFIIENEMAAVEIPLRKLPTRAITKLEISGKQVLSCSLTQSPSQTGTTSLNPEAILSAKLDLVAGLSDGMRLAKSTTVPVDIKVENIGAATWLTFVSTFTLDDRIGFVSVGLLWFRRGDVHNGQVVAGKDAVYSGRIPITHDMAPASTATLSHAITVPDQPGEYTVFLEMVSDGVCWFGDRHNSTVLRYNVVVE